MTRKRISASFGNNPERLVAQYIELQKQYSDRLIMDTIQFETTKT
ncbi:hypothetical protein WDW89_16165 [Deltaproteobacteria bacterium TL4]